MRGHQYVLKLVDHTSELTQNFPPHPRWFTDRLITAKDHAAIQISVADVDANGVAQNSSTSFAISGQVRAMGESDDSINRLATKAGRKFPCFVVLPSIFNVTSLGFFWVQCSETFGRVKSRYVSCSLHFPPVVRLLSKLCSSCILILGV
jgi:hypothetical protein